MNEELKSKYRALLIELENISKELDELNINELESSNIIKDNLLINNEKYQEDQIKDNELNLINLRRDIKQNLIPIIKNKI